METQKRVSSLSLLTEARHELRTHLALETALVECISTLPEDDFCHHTREALQYGASYAYCQRESSGADELDHVFIAYFTTQPRNRYLEEETVREAQQRVIDSALEHLEDQDLEDLDPVINQYTVKALVAFIYGYRMTRDYFESQGYTSPTPAAESA